MLNTHTHDTTKEAPVAAVSRGMAVGGTAVMAPPINIVATVTTALQQMLVLFKQGDNAANRQQLVGIARSLVIVEANATNWQALVAVTAQAIANQHNTYNAVAPLVIRELKQAGDLLAANRDRDITISANLQQAAAPVAPVAPVAAVTATVPTQITIPVDVRGAAQGILQNFSRQQVTELVVLLHRAISNSKQN